MCKLKDYPKIKSNKDLRFVITKAILSQTSVFSKNDILGIVKEYVTPVYRCDESFVSAVFTDIVRSFVRTGNLITAGDKYLYIDFKVG